MRLEDIQLRSAAKRGDPQACLAVAKQLFAGRPGTGPTPKLGLAYLQGEIARQSPAAFKLIGQAVPLHVLIGQQLQRPLLYAAHQDCAAAMLKWGVWLALSAATREEGIAWLVRVHPSACERLHGPEEFAQVLREVDAREADFSEAAVLGARQALAERDVAQACWCIRLAWDLAECSSALAETIAATVCLAEQLRADLPLPVAVVERGLALRGEHGAADAQYALGCAYAGIAFGHLPPGQLVRAKNMERAAALLLRAADGGKHRAWLHLFDVSPATRAANPAHGMARFFLEKAAAAGVCEAQTRLGALLLKEALSLQAAEIALTWLHRASQGGDARAAETLATLVLPLPDLRPDDEAALLERIAQHDRELAVRLSVARRLHLTRHEALSFNPKRDLRDWGILVRGSSKENPNGRLAPALTDAMRAALAQAAAFFQAGSALDSSLVLQRSRTQRRIFKLLGIADGEFFAPGIGRSRSHHGWGRHWAAKASSVLPGDAKPGKEDRNGANDGADVA
jgi:TPR repeat protein